MSSVVLENGLDIRQVVSAGSVLHINQDFDETEPLEEFEEAETKTIDFIGHPVKSFDVLETQVMPVDQLGLVKKKILEEGGGLPLHERCTVSIAYSGYWENGLEPFDVRKANKPLVVDLKDSGLLPGLQTAVESMLVGEVSVFLISYEVMYGELGIPPRIKPKSNCVFFIKLIKSILTPMQGKVDYSEPNMFERIYHEVKLLYSSGVTLYKTRNFSAAIQMFRKATFMLHKCRLADQNEERKQERMLIKLYTNLAICNNIIKQPLRACSACNELNRLNSLWNNGKVLFQNAKALRMLGQFNEAEKKLKRAMKLCPCSKEIDAELELLQKSRVSCNQSKLLMDRIAGSSIQLVTEEFKQEVDTLIKNFKENDELCKLTLPEGLNFAEIDYLRKACIRENLFFNKIKKDYALDKDEEIMSNDDNEIGSELQEIHESLLDLDLY